MFNWIGRQLGLSDANSENGDQDAAIASRELAATKNTLVLLSLIGLAILLILALAAAAVTPTDGQPFDNFLLVLGGSTAMASAAGASGALLGFLFGVPRALQGDEGKAGPVNTNLEQISDWLTKIIVGVSLTQLAEIPGFLLKVATELAPLVDKLPSKIPVAVSILVIFSVLGFFAGYLLTRLFLTGAMARADRLASDGGQSPDASPEMDALRAMLGRVIDSLPEAKAKALLDTIVAAFPDRMAEMAEAQYPPSVRQGDTTGAHARGMLKRAVVLTVNSNADLAHWQFAMAAL